MLTVDVLVLGFANLVADAISMGLGDFLSCKAEQDVIAEKRQATEWDVMNRRGSEQTELVRHYEDLGMENSDATMVCMRKTSHLDSHGKSSSQLIY